MEKNQNLEEMQETTILNPNENDEGNAKKPAKKTIIVSTIAAVVVLAGVGGGYAYASNTTYDSYESQLESAKEAGEDTCGSTDARQGYEGNGRA